MDKDNDDRDQGGGLICCDCGGVIREHYVNWIEDDGERKPRHGIPSICAGVLYGKFHTALQKIERLEGLILGFVDAGHKDGTLTSRSVDLHFTYLELEARRIRRERQGHD
jgi:hypothetical protein